MAVILPFTSSSMAGVREQPEPELLEASLSDWEQLLHSMQAVDGALSAIKSYLIDEAKASMASKPDLSMM